MAQMHGKNGVTCENCHGAGKAHVDGGGDTSKIFNPAKGTAKEVDAKCLGCHQGQHSNFERSGHGEANVSCVACHSVHGGADPEHLLKAAQPVLCFQCHGDVKPNFSMPFHHKVEEGLLKLYRLPRSARNVRTEGPEVGLATGCGLHQVPCGDGGPVCV